MFKSIKKYKKLVFKQDRFAYLINVIFPRQNSRANSISIIEEKDFLKWLKFIMNYLISSKEEFFSLKKGNNISIYTESFELFCLLKKHGAKYFFSNFLLNKSKNSDKIIEVFSKNWFLDQANKEYLM